MTTKDHKEIWLQCQCAAKNEEGRLWAEDNPFELCDLPDCSGPQKYIRADLYDAEASFGAQVRQITHAYDELIKRSR